MTARQTKSAAVTDSLHQYAGATVAVLGASGFIGRWVARLLAARGAVLFFVVRDARRAREVLTAYGARGTFIEADLSDVRSIGPLLELVRPSVVFNLVGYGVDPRERDPAGYRLNESLIEALAIKLARVPAPGWAGQRVVHAGSALEYGRAGGSLDEQTTPLPTTEYGRSKLAGTEALQRVCARTGLRAIVGRLFTVYGPGEHHERLVPTLFRAVRTQESIPLTAGDQKRDFTYVEDAAEGLLRLGLCAAEGGSIVNVATGRVTPVREAASTAAAVLGIPQPRLRFGELPTRGEEMHHSEVAIDRLKRLTGWSPGVSVAEGIRRAAAFLAIVDDPNPDTVVAPKRL